MLECDKIRYLYSIGTPFETVALEDVDFYADEGELIGIIGHTGSGKSTLIQHFNALLKPNSGFVYLDGRDVWAKENKKNIRNVRFKVGECFQYPENQIFEDTVYNEIAFAPKQAGLDDKEIHRRVYNSMEFVGLPKNIADNPPLDLSGGQMRRIAIASVIAMEPKILVLDEPCAGLDPQGRRVILDLIKKYQSSGHGSVILVSHSMEDIAALCTRVYVLKDGAVYMSGLVDEIFSRYNELYNIGLDIPEITRIFIKLKENGVQCRTNIYNIEDAKDELNRLFTLKK